MPSPDATYTDPEWGNVLRRKEATEETIPSILKSLPMFETLTAPELVKVERIVHRRRFAAGEVIIRARAPRSGMYIVKSGSVDVVRPMGNGIFHKVGRLEAGDLLGEFAILDDSPRSTSIVAAEPSELLGFFKPDLMELVETDPRLGLKIVLRVAEMMTRRLRQDIELLRSLQKPVALDKAV
jgi:CRP-like cAMP-binding protein